jgi:hypothetical protein
MMEALSELEFKNSAEASLRSVFGTDDPYDKPFKTEITHRLLLYGFRWELHSPWIEPIDSAIRTMGEGGFYVSALKRPMAEEQTRSYHWYVPLGEIDQYGSVIYSQQNAIYSCHGRWGIICSDEDHALVGGPEVLIEMIRNSVPDIDERVRKFLEMWRYYHDNNKVSIDWLPGLLEHIYGNQVARRLLEEADLQKFGGDI